MVIKKHIPCYFFLQKVKINPETIINKTKTIPVVGILSSANTRSKIALTNCLMVAAAVLMVVLSLVKCKRKHNTRACTNQRKLYIYVVTVCLKVQSPHINIFEKKELGCLTYQQNMHHLYANYSHTLDIWTQRTSLHVSEKYRKLFTS